MTEDLAPVSGSTHLTSSLLNSSKNLACLPSLPPSPQTVVVSGGARRWQLCFWLSLHSIMLQQSPNKTFFDQT